MRHRWWTDPNRAAGEIILMSDNRDIPLNVEKTFDQRSFLKDKFLGSLAAIVSLFVIGALLWPVGGHRGGGPRTYCKNNIKQILLALANYESHYGALPPAHTLDANGMPLHSWRTLILPFLDQQNLYDSIDLSKPWDDPKNEIAMSTPVDAFRCPASKCPKNFTSYLAVITPDSCLQDHHARRMTEIKHDHSRTVIILEVTADHAVPWMSPQDSDEELLMGFGPTTKLPHTTGPQAGMLDLHVESLSPTMSASERRGLISATTDDR